MVSGICIIIGSVMETVMAMNDKNVTPNDAKVSKKDAIDGDKGALDVSPDIIGEEAELDLAEMTKGHTGLKLLILAMGIGILVLVFMVAMKSIDMLASEEEQAPAVSTQINTNTAKPVIKAEIDLQLPTSTKGQTVVSASQNGMVLTLVYGAADVGAGAGAGQTVILIDLTSGKILSIVRLKP